MRRVRALAAAMTVGLLSAQLPAAAQVVTGIVVEQDTGRPLADVRLTLFAEDGAAVASGSTAADGGFELRAPGAGTYVLFIEPGGYLSTTRTLPPLDQGGRLEERIEMPLISGAAARVMSDVISRETAFQLPLEELCQEPLRPWEAGLLLGVARDRRSMRPVPGALVRLGPDAPDSIARFTVATPTGAYWFCNVPAGQARVHVRADGFRPETFTAAVRAGSIAWYDALLRAR